MHTFTKVCMKVGVSLCLLKYAVIHYLCYTDG